MIDEVIDYLYGNLSEFASIALEARICKQGDDVLGEILEGQRNFMVMNGFRDSVQHKRRFADLLTRLSAATT